MEHRELTSIISMRPGHKAGATCSCGWHSHTKTFADHIAEVDPEERQHSAHH